MELEYYERNGRYFVSNLSDLPMSHTDKPSAETPLAWLFDRDPSHGRTSFCVSDPRQLTVAAEDLRFLDPDRLTDWEPLKFQRIRNLIQARSLRAVNIRHPRWERALDWLRMPSGKKRVHLLAVGDVGSTLLTGLKLLGGDCISVIGIYDLNASTVRRWVSEMGQVGWPWHYDALPTVEAVDAAHLFDCDVFLFAAARSIPPLDSGVRDVRMAQFDANCSLVEFYARQARDADYGGLFCVLSDPVDPLCKAAYRSSNSDVHGNWDGLGLLPEQIHGFGLGVMNARAADLARQEPRYQSFLSDGRSFGPHGQGLVIANSIAHYDDTLSRELTVEVLEANLHIRALGFKPYAAPALSSGALQLLLLLRGQWHCGSVCLGDVWFGCRCRYTAMGVETENLSLPQSLFLRLQEAEQSLRQIL